MASQWRIRHKLMLGLILVLGVMALLLGGTLHGLWSYYVTMNNIRSKETELKSAEALKEAVGDVSRLLKAYDPHDQHASNTIKEAIDKAINQRDGYAKLFEESASQGYYDFSKAEDIRAYLVRLEEVFNLLLEYTGHTMVGPKSGPSASTQEITERNLKPVQDQISEMETLANILREELFKGLDSSIEASRRHYQIALWMIVPASVIGLLLICGLMPAFYWWVLYPIRDLAAGVVRVAQGDFAHRIKLNSGDEMQDLGEAFNEMTQRLQALYNDLARQVNERSRQLVRSEKLASVGFLAAGVAHEINNPLASIAFCSEALEARMATLMRYLPTSVQKGDDLEVFMRYLKMIQEEAFRCKTITEKLLDFSRNGERRREPTDLDRLVHSVLDITQHLQSSKGKQIVFESQTERVPGGRIIAAVNAEEIKSVVLNLVVNALDSMDDGGQLKIRLGMHDGMAEMEFSDSGCGMSQEVLENIFEPFFTRSRTGKGTGLGLTISHRIINQHGGDIEAASPGPNQGSTFTVRLPVQVAESLGNLPLAA